LKKEWKRGGNKPVLKGQVLGMVFQKPSLRTRVSFDMAMRHLGGDALYLSPNEIGLGGREAVSDVARVLSRYVQAIMARTFSHQHIEELARWSSVPVINGLSEYNHPCQALADGLTILEHKGRLQGVNVTFIGDGNNVAVSLLHLCAKLGANFTLAAPDGYGLPAKAIEIARPLAEASGATLRFLNSPPQAVQDADVIYTDTWTSMGQEAETEKRRQVFPPFQVNRALVAEAAPDAIVMHCLPAHRGEEVTDEVMDGPQSVVFDEAENRLHAQKAILYYLLVEHGQGKPSGRRTRRTARYSGYSHPPGRCAGVSASATSGRSPTARLGESTPAI
jgi:ornithine carbamoyltransferase